MGKKQKKLSYPWEVTTEQSLEEIVREIQVDMLFALRHTAILVRSSDEQLRMVVNSERGQEIPKGICTYNDGTTIEFQDIGMPQIGVPLATIQEIMQMVHAKATELGLWLP